LGGGGQKGGAAEAVKPGWKKWGKCVGKKDGGGRGHKAAAKGRAFRQRCGYELRKWPRKNVHGRQLRDSQTGGRGKMGGPD